MNVDDVGFRHAAVRGHLGEIRSIFAAVIHADLDDRLGFKARQLDGIDALNDALHVAQCHEQDIEFDVQRDISGHDVCDLGPSQGAQRGCECLDGPACTQVDVGSEPDVGAAFPRSDDVADHEAALSTARMLPNRMPRPASAERTSFRISTAFGLSPWTQMVWT